MIKTSAVSSHDTRYALTLLVCIQMLISSAKVYHNMTAQSSPALFYNIVLKVKNVLNLKAASNKNLILSNGFQYPVKETCTSHQKDCLSVPSFCMI